MECSRRRLTIAGLLVAAVLAGCGSQVQPGPTLADCGDLMRQARYEAQAAVARAGLAANPVRLAELAQVTATGSVVDLPEHEAFVEWDDGRQLTLLSALDSASIGVGHILTDDAITDSLNASGPCQGWMD